MAITELPTPTNRPRPVWLADDVISADLIHKLNEHADAAREILQLVRTWVETHQVLDAEYQRQMDEADAYTVDGVADAVNAWSGAQRCYDVSLVLEYFADGSTDDERLERPFDSIGGLR